jgi:hypothetical protein
LFCCSPEKELDATTFRPAKTVGQDAFLFILYYYMRRFRQGDVLQDNDMSWVASALQEFNLEVQKWAPGTARLITGRTGSNGSFVCFCFLFFVFCFLFLFLFLF